MTVRKKRSTSIKIVLASFIGLLVSTNIGHAQLQPRGSIARDPFRADIDPCPRGKVYLGVVEWVVSSPDLLRLLYISDPIIVGTIAKVLPAVDPEPASRGTPIPETDSLVD